MDEDRLRLALNRWEATAAYTRKRVYAAYMTYFSLAQPDVIHEFVARVERAQRTGDLDLAEAYSAAIVLIEAGQALPKPPTTPSQ